MALSTMTHAPWTILSSRAAIGSVVWYCDRGAGTVPARFISSKGARVGCYLVLGGIAEFERELIKARTGEGRARAKANGVHLGRPGKLTAHQRREAIARLDAGEAQTDIARTFGVSHTTIGRLLARLPA